jgi:hypothetical protein
MSWEQRLREMDARNLDQFEQNARRVHETGTSAQQPEAERALTAVARERHRRAVAERRRMAAFAAAGQGQDGGALYARVKTAFSALPPNEREAAMLRAVAAAPGNDCHAIAISVGGRPSRVTALSFGRMCHLRELYLGPPPPARASPSKPDYVGLLIDYSAPRQEPDGHSWTGWTLKQEALAALQALHIVG